jgi:extradiol dioxygenase family protein
MKSNEDAGIVFHLAIPTHDLDEAEASYTNVVGARRARRYDDRVTFELFRHQVVCHLNPSGCELEAKIYPRHYGITFKDAVKFKQLYDRVARRPEFIFQDLARRFADKPERHSTFFLRDPSNNMLEFKCYDDPEFVY